MEMTEERIRELQEINQPEEERKGKRKKRVVPCRTISKGTRIPKGNERKNGTEKLKKNVSQISKFGERHKYGDSRSTANTKQGKFK